MACWSLFLWWGENLCLLRQIKKSCSYHDVGYLKYLVLLLVYCFHYMRLGWLLMLLLLVLFAEFQSGFLELQWLEHQRQFCSRCLSHWYCVWLTTWCLFPRQLCCVVGCCFWLNLKCQIPRYSFNEESGVFWLSKWFKSLLMNMKTLGKGRFLWHLLTIL